MKFQFKNQIHQWIVLSILFAFVCLSSFIFLGFVIGTNAVNTWDIGVYYKYAVATVEQHQIPYVDFFIEYPQLILVTILLPYFPVMIFSPDGNPNIFIISHVVLMFLIWSQVLVFTYFIAVKFYGNKRGMLAGLMCAAAVPTTYFVFFRYDAWPTFFLVGSLYFFICRGDEIKGYAAVAFGILAKWFPFILAPFYFLYDLKHGGDYKRHLLILASILGLVSIPFLMLSLTGFVYPYFFNSGYRIQAESVPFLLGNFFGELHFFEAWANVFLILILGSVFWFYYREKKKDTKTLFFYITVALYLFVLFNKLGSPQYIVWLTPLLAILLSGRVSSIFVFAILQIFQYIDFPVLFEQWYDTTGYLISYAPAFFAIKYVFWILALIFFVWINSKEETAE